MNVLFRNTLSPKKLMEWLEIQDYASILTYARPLSPKTRASRLLSLFQSTTQHDDEFCLYMAIMIAKLKTGDLIEALDDHLTDVTTLPERRELFL